MRKRFFLPVLCLVAFAALAADDAVLDAEIARGQAVATIVGESIGALIGASTVFMFVWRPIRRWRRRRQRDRLEHEAMLEFQRLAAEDRRVDARIATALATFRKTVVEAEMTVTLNALKATLDVHTRDAQDQIAQVSSTMSSLAHNVAEIATRMEARCNQTNERMDDFLNAMAVGVVPHFRKTPREPGK